MEQFRSRETCRDHEERNEKKVSRFRNKRERKGRDLLGGRWTLSRRDSRRMRLKLR